MFKCKFAMMYDNTIFTQYGLQPVAEDYFKIEKNIFCVADGVTRDDINGKPVPYPSNKEETLEWIKVYPNPSGAGEAARIIADNFVKYLGMYPENEINESILANITKQVNKAIWEINKDRRIDYLKEDLYCCEAVGGILVKDTMYCFSIGDCHITALDENLNTIFTTLNNHKQFENYIDLIYTKENSFDWNNPEDRIMARRDYRNKPDKKYQGKDISFGALSGEKEAEYYIDTYQVNLEKVNYICAYSDGCEAIFEDKEYLKKVIQNPESLKQEGKERTLILYEKIK